MSIYDIKPARLLSEIHDGGLINPRPLCYCAGFELGEWRCNPFANHLVEWLPDYALLEEELSLHHGNAYVKLQQAAVRVYTSAHYDRRGEAGEIGLHAVCRDFFDTIPIAPRVHYKSSSNDPIKAFDMVHARFPSEDSFEIWLGESKLYSDANEAITSAIASITDHIDGGFLTREKLILGPQISKNIPHYDRIIKIFKAQTSIDKLLEASVFVIGVMCTSTSVKKSAQHSDEYKKQCVQELDKLTTKLQESQLSSKLKIVLVYVPLRSKQKLAFEFDRRLKGLQS